MLEGATEASTVRDAGRIAVIQVVKHLEIARYGTLVAGAGALAVDDAVKILGVTLGKEMVPDTISGGLAVTTIGDWAKEAA